MAHISSSNVTAGFIDLATFDEIEKYLYGSELATAYFVRETRHSTWFTQVPVVLSGRTSSPEFGHDWSVTISRAADYLLNSWLRVTIPAVTKVNDATTRIRWTRNLMHNLIVDCSVTFNDLVASRFDNFFLDFWTAFTVPEGKRAGYNNMIGNVTELTTPTDGTLPEVTLNLPLPFFFSRDSGVALPTAALPYNEMRINFSFRNWTDLLVVDTGVTNSYTSVSRAATINDVTAVPSLGTTQVWANYAIVSNDERKKMAQAPRDILIEQTQNTTRNSFHPLTNATPRFDLRFSHSIKVLFFGVRNTTSPSNWSNYTAASPVVNDANDINFNPIAASDPIIRTSLVYENTARLASMGSDYFSLVNPYYHAPVIPLETGYHCYSYSLDFDCLDPLGSTNYGKLTNVSIVPEASDQAVSSSTQGNTDEGLGQAQTFEFICMAVNNNVIRISGGALGFPVL